MMNFYSSDILSEISPSIKQNHLTHCLELLEKWGYDNDAALRLLAYLQAEGVAS